MVWRDAAGCRRSAESRPSGACANGNFGASGAGASLRRFCASPSSFHSPAEYVYGRVAAAPAPAKTSGRTGQIGAHSALRAYATRACIFTRRTWTAAVIRFLVIHKPNGDSRTALDACQICGTAGYRQEGQNVICRNCGAVDLHSVDRRQRAAAIPSREIARGRRRSDRGPLGAGRRRLARFTPDAMFARLVRESFARNPRRKMLTAAALVVGMAVATATLTSRWKWATAWRANSAASARICWSRRESDTLPRGNRRRGLPSRG